MPYLFIKIAVDELSPSVVAWSRLAIAAAVLLPMAWKIGALRGLGAGGRRSQCFAAVEMAVPWQLLGFGEVHVSSSLAAILIATVPAVRRAPGPRFDHAERPTRTRLVGMLIGLAAWSRSWESTSAATARRCWARWRSSSSPSCTPCGPMIVKRRLSDVDPLGPVAASVGIATLLVTPFALADLPDSAPSADTIARSSCSGLLCSALAFLFFFRLIAEVGPGRATVITYINPVVALALGVPCSTRASRQAWWWACS